MPFSSSARVSSTSARVLLYLEENEVNDFSLTTMPVPDDPNQLATWRKNYVKARKILMDFVKNHLVYHMGKEETSKDMFE